MKTRKYISPKVILKLHTEDIITESPGDGGTELPPITVWSEAGFRTGD